MDGGCIDLSIADEGCGIGPEHLMHIFERFHRLDKVRSRAMGLDLSIAQTIVKIPI